MSLTTALLISAAEARYWLNFARQAYRDKRYRDASYGIGMASHYITDTYAAARIL